MDRFRGAPGRLGLTRLLAQTGKVLRLARTEGVHELAERVRFRLKRSRDKTAYRAWVERYATLTEPDRAAIRSRLRELPYRPLISVVMPIYNTDEVWLRQAIGSVLRQLYPHWELCLADDNSSLPHVRAVLEEYAARDIRIKLVFRDRNGHISAASNSALALASGEFVALLDHDDELAEHALYVVVEELNRHPEADLLYSDEDKIDQRGRRYEPFFKPDWNPDLFYSLNLVTHLAVYRRSVLDAVKGFREGLEGSQDYDLTLRVIERIPPAAIRHIPQLLYHWRAIPGSVALAPEEKEYAHEAARQAIRAHLERRGVPAEVRGAPENANLHRVVYPLPAPAPLVSLILPVSGQPVLLRRSVASLLARTDYAPFELLLAGGPAVDTAEALQGLREDPRVRVLNVRAAAPAVAAGVAMACARGEVVGLLGLVEPIADDWLGEMVSHALRPEIGAVGAKLYDRAGAIAHAGIILGAGGVASWIYRGLLKSEAHTIARLLTVQNYSAVTGACLVARREVIEQVGGLDAEHLPSAYFDVDLCLRLSESGYRTLWTPYAELRWLEADTTGPPAEEVSGNLTLAQQERYMMSRWGGVLHRDPNFNPNLSPEREDGGLAVPPRLSFPWASAGPTG
jgi:GT2 family glycosyltransferase